MTSYIKSINYGDLKKSKRFDVRFFFLQDTIKKYSESNQVDLIELGDKSLLIEITDGEHSGQKFLCNGVRFIKNGNVKDFDISITDEFYISEEKQKLLKRSALHEEDILFTTIGHLGSAAIVPKDFGEANINQNLVRMKVNKDVIDPYYLTAFLNSSFIRRQIDCLFTGNIQKILTYPKIKSIKIIKADIEFQNEVRNLYIMSLEYNKNAFLYINKVKELLRERLGLNSYKADKTNEYEVTFDDVKNKIWTPKYYYPQYISTIEYLKKNFTCYSIKDLANYTSGDEVGSDAYNSYLEKKDTDVPFIRTSDIYNYQYDICPDNFVDYSIYQELNQQIKNGDILFSNDGKIGMVAMVNGNEKFIVQSHINIVRLKTDLITQEYLFAILMLDEINYYQTDKCTVIQSTLSTLAGRFGEFVIPILDDSTIKEVTSIIKQVNLLFEKKRNCIKKIESKIENLLNNI